MGVVFDKKSRRLVFITSLLYLLMVALCAHGLWLRGIENMPSIYVLNVGMEIFAMLTGYMLFISCIVDVQKSGTDLKWFIYRSDRPEQALRKTHR